MNYFDIIRMLKNNKPERERTARALKSLGWLVIGVTALNILIFVFNLPGAGFQRQTVTGYYYYGLGAFAFTSLLYFQSSGLIRNNEESGIFIAQAAVVLSAILFCGLFLYAVRGIFAFPMDDAVFSAVFIFFISLTGLQFAVLALLGTRYLSRLKPGTDYRTAFSDDGSRDHLHLYEKNQVYSEALLPFGVHGTFFAVIAVPMIIIFSAMKFFPGDDIFPFFIFILVGSVFISQIIYNSSASSFQKGRNLIDSFTGGGSIFLFNGSWPFFKLLIYGDGVEIRVMFNRFFIPYSQMTGIEKSGSFFSRGIYIRSNLPGVPSGIRFYGSSTDTIMNRISELKGKSQDL